MGKNFKSKQLKQARIGEKSINKNGSHLEIIDYQSAINIIVKFDSGYITRSTYRQFQKGEIRNPYEKNLYCIGFLGEGKYKAKNNGVYTKQYRHWYNMFLRCYDEKLHQKHPTYKMCTVCDEWHSFQSFAKWYDENYYEIESQTMHLDKDILHKGNKLYCPESCVFVPQCINTLFIKRDNDRGEYPIGVSLHHRETLPDNYQALVNDANNLSKYLGVFETIEDAFHAYKNEKEKIIKQMAEKYKNMIPLILYQAMYNYQVEITD